VQTIRAGPDRAHNPTATHPLLSRLSFTTCPYSERGAASGQLAWRELGPTRLLCCKEGRQRTHYERVTIVAATAPFDHAFEEPDSACEWQSLHLLERQAGKHALERQAGERALER